ncbi:hypothetical protein ABS71_15885 [bacterium SCN 62-11]|nr:MAG: hypothetical protein ABS71_15885 [bacterium SCN 62-11]
MIIDVYGLLPGAREVDTSKLIATVELAHESGKVTVFNEVRVRIVRELFENDFCSFVAEPDAVTDHKAWTPQAIEQILEEELPSFSLRGIIRP